jgi:hypothetical protein
MRPVLLYGPYKVGKSTLLAEMAPEEMLLIATEPGQAALEVFREDVASWEEFLVVCGELAAGNHSFKYVGIDTVDNLARFCEEYVISSMAKTAGKTGYVHVSDFDWGKGSAAVTKEFSLKVAKLCQLGLGVFFVSHEKEGKVKTNTGLELDTVAPDVGAKGMRKFLLGYVDFILHAESIETTEGEQRVLRTRPKVIGDVRVVEAGGRVPRSSEPLPELIRLDAGELRAAMAKVAG